MVQDQMTQDEMGAGISAGAIVATAVPAGVIAFLIKRAVHGESHASRPEEAMVAAREAFADADLPGRSATAAREFLVERILPELKPILRDIIKDIKSYVDDGFKRLER